MKWRSSYFKPWTWTKVKHENKQTKNRSTSPGCVALWLVRDNEHQRSFYRGGEGEALYPTIVFICFTNFSLYDSFFVYLFIYFFDGMGVGRRLGNNRPLVGSDKCTIPFLGLSTGRPGEDTRPLSGGELWPRNEVGNLSHSKKKR